MRKPTDTRARLLTAAALAAAVVASSAYIAGTRESANEAISIIMASQIPNAFKGANGRPLSADMSLDEFTQAYGALAFMSPFYLDSDAAQAVPDVSAPTSSAWLMLTFAKEVWEHEDAGDTKPLVSQIYSAEPALLVNPTLKQMVVESPQGPRIDNTDHRAVVAAIMAARQSALVARDTGLSRHDVIPLDSE